MAEAEQDRAGKVGEGGRVAVRQHKWQWQRQGARGYSTEPEKGGGKLNDVTDGEGEAGRDQQRWETRRGENRATERETGGGAETGATPWGIVWPVAEALEERKNTRGGEETRGGRQTERRRTNKERSGKKRQRHS